MNTILRTVTTSALRQHIMPLVRASKIRRARVRFRRRGPYHRCRVDARLYDGTRVVVRAFGCNRIEAIRAATDRLEAALGAGGKLVLPSPSCVEKTVDTC